MTIPRHIDTSNMSEHAIRNLAEPQRVAAPFRADTDKPIIEGSPIIEWIPGDKDQCWDGPDYNEVNCDWGESSETDIHGGEVDWDNNPHAECENTELEWYVNSVWTRERSRAIPLEGGEPHQMDLVKDTGIMDQFHSTFCLACALRLRLITQDQIKAAGMEDELKGREASAMNNATVTFYTNPPGSGYEPSATVTIQRSTLDGIIDITVAFAQRGGQWFFTHILDEDGNEMFLSETEELIARSLVAAGVDETGR